MHDWRCDICGSQTAVVRGDHRFTESGLKSVILKGVEFVRCDQCNSKELIIPHMNELMRVIALAFLWKPGKLKGEDVKYLRKYVGLSAVDFSRTLGVDPTTLSKWENDHDPVGSANDRLIRLVVLAMSDDDLRELHEEFSRLVKERFQEIDSSRDYKTTVDMDTAGMPYEYA